LAEVTVVTYLGIRKLHSFQPVLHRGAVKDGVEVLVSVDLARFLRSLHISLDRFLFFRYLKAEAGLTNGLVMGGPVPLSITAISQQPWSWRPR
jgi:hypothetical protein